MVLWFSSKQELKANWKARQDYGGDGRARMNFKLLCMCTCGEVNFKLLIGFQPIFIHSFFILDLLADFDKGALSSFFSLLLRLSLSLLPRLRGGLLSLLAPLSPLPSLRPGPPCPCAPLLLGSRARLSSGMFLDCMRGSTMLGEDW